MLLGIAVGLMCTSVGSILSQPLHSDSTGERHEQRRKAADELEREIRPVLQHEQDSDPGDSGEYNIKHSLQPVVADTPLVAVTSISLMLALALTTLVLYGLLMNVEVPKSTGVAVVQLQRDVLRGDSPDDLHLCVVRSGKSEPNQGARRPTRSVLKRKRELLFVGDRILFRLDESMLRRSGSSLRGGDQGPALAVG